MAGHFDDGPDDEVDQIKGGAVDKQKKPPPSALSARRVLLCFLADKIPRVLVHKAHYRALDGLTERLRW